MSLGLPPVNNNSISIFKKTKDDIHGIFALLKDLNRFTKSRYNLTDESLKQDKVWNLDQYYEEKRYYISDENVTEFSITFDSPFLLSGYSISNAKSSDNNTFPRDWAIYGQSLQNQKHLIPLDKRVNQYFCGQGIRACVDENIRTYDTLSVYQSRRAFKTFIFRQIENSWGKNYILMRAIDLYGTLCGQDGSCSFIHFTCKQTSKIHFRLLFLSLVF